MTQAGGNADRRFVFAGGAMEKKIVKLSEIIFNQSIYPRKTHNPAKVQEYALNLEQIEAVGNYIHISQKFNLLDGRHRHLAYLKNNEGKESETDVPVYVHEMQFEADEYKKAVSVAVEKLSRQLTKLKSKRNNRI